MSSGKEIKLNEDKGLLNHSGKAFSQEGVGIPEVFLFSDTTDVIFFSSSNACLLICVLISSRNNR